MEGRDIRIGQVRILEDTCPIGDAARLQQLEEGGQEAIALSFTWDILLRGSWDLFSRLLGDVSRGGGSIDWGGEWCQRG